MPKAVSEWFAIPVSLNLITLGHRGQDTQEKGSMGLCHYITFLFSSIRETHGRTSCVSVRLLAFPPRSATRPKKIALCNS